MSDNDLPSEEKDKTSKSDVASTQDTPPEVFDSSTYDSMTDLKSSATMNESETNKVLLDTEDKEPIGPEAVDTESTRNPKTSSTVPQTMEGRASTLKKLKQSQSQSISKQLDKQTIQINKKVGEILQPLQKHIKSLDKQSELIKQLQSQLKQLQKQVSQIQRAVNIGKKKRK
jgi:DNA anti-recombination protein RmuC